MKQGFRFAAVSTVLLVLGACQAPADGTADSATSPMELKIYAVPAAQTAQLAGALGNALGKKANVTMPVPGKLLVYAPQQAQGSIGEALASLGQDASAADDTAQVNLRFWVVDGHPGAGADDVALKPLSAAFDSLRRTLGPMHFQLEQAAASVATTGHGGVIVTTTPAGYPRTFDFRVGPAAAGGVELTLDYQDAGPAGLRRFNTEVGARFGDYLVLAQAPGGACPVVLTSGKQTASCSPDTSAMRLLIVRLDRLNPSV
jgi:hypothetical protein